MRTMASDQQLNFDVLAQFVDEFNSVEFIEMQPDKTGHVLLDTQHPAAESDTLSPTSSCSTKNEDNRNEVDQRSPVRGGRSRRLESSNESADRRREIRAAQAAKRQLRYLKKVRTEREMLKQQEVELSAVLSKLRAAQALSVVQAVNNLALGAWKATAIRQKERRLEAEATQRRLRALVVDHARLIRNTNELLQQRLVQIPMASLELHPSSEATSGSLFKTFVQELDVLYAMTNEVTAGANFKLSSLPLRFELTRDWNHDMTFLESADATEISASYDQTWRVMSSILLSNTEGIPYTGEIDDPANTTATTYRLAYTLDSGDTATLVFYNVLRRYVETDRVVFVWRTLTEGQGEFNDLYSDEHAWLVIRPSDSCVGSATKLESYTRLKPMRLDGQPASIDSRGYRFVKFLSKADDEDIAYIKGDMEKLLDKDVVMELKL